MKRKKILSLILAMLIVLSACGSNKDQAGSLKSGTKKVTVGISQFARHKSLDNCREGFIEGLRESGYKEGQNLVVDYQNADTSIDMSNQIALNFASKKYDMIGAIATPAAMSAYSQIRNSDIALVYTAINDPVAAQLAKKDKSPIGNATGTSDALPVEDQLKLIREMLPQAKTIGIMYTISEANSISTIEVYKEYAPKYGFELKLVGVSAASEIPLATDKILNEVDCLTNITDNTVVNSLPTILAKAKEKKTPVFGSEIEQVKLGCIGAQGIDYFQLGIQTGKMAAKILNGEAKASEINYETVEESKLYINKAVAKNLGINLSENLLNRASEIFESTEN